MKFQLLNLHTLLRLSWPSEIGKEVRLLVIIGGGIMLKFCSLSLKILIQSTICQWFTADNNYHNIVSRHISSRISIPVIKFKIIIILRFLCRKCNIINLVWRCILIQLNVQFCYNCHAKPCSIITQIYIFFTELTSFDELPLVVTVGVAGLVSCFRQFPDSSANINN